MAGRWFSPDPLSEEYSDWSPYTMVLNNPIKNIDPVVLQDKKAKLLSKNGRSCCFLEYGKMLRP